MESCFQKHRPASPSYCQNPAYSPLISFSCLTSSIAVRALLQPRRNGEENTVRSILNKSPAYESILLGSFYKAKREHPEALLPIPWTYHHFSCSPSIHTTTMDRSNSPAPLQLPSTNRSSYESQDQSTARNHTYHAYMAKRHYHLPGPQQEPRSIPSLPQSESTVSTWSTTSSTATSPSSSVSSPSSASSLPQSSMSYHLPLRPIKPRTSYELPSDTPRPDNRNRTSSLDSPEAASPRRAAFEMHRPTVECTTGHTRSVSVYSAMTESFASLSPRHSFSANRVHEAPHMSAEVELEKTMFRD